MPSLLECKSAAAVGGCGRCSRHDSGPSISDGGAEAGCPAQGARSGGGGASAQGGRQREEGGPGVGRRDAEASGARCRGRDGGDGWSPAAASSPPQIRRGMRRGPLRALEGGGAGAAMPSPSSRRSRIRGWMGLELRRPSPPVHGDNTLMRWPTGGGGAARRRRRREAPPRPAAVWTTVAPRARRRVDARWVSSGCASPAAPSSVRRHAAPPPLSPRRWRSKDAEEPRDGRSRTDGDACDLFMSVGDRVL
jgi:hypothetical protein